MVGGMHGCPDQRALVLPPAQGPHPICRLVLPCSLSTALLCGFPSASPLCALSTRRPPHLLADRRELLSAGADGSLALAPLEAGDGTAGSRLYGSAGAVTFAAARWNGPHTAVTGSLQGGAWGGAGASQAVE